MAKKNSRSRKSKGRVSAARAELRQRAQPPEFRIPRIDDADLSEFIRRFEADAGSRQKDGGEVAVSPGMGPEVLAVMTEMANCLWYLRTKHFRRAWEGGDDGDDDPRVRRALGRISRGVAALKRFGIEIQDLTGRRFPSGGESMLKPIDMVPVAGLGVERISETVQPVVFWRETLIQRGEVFVEVPQVDQAMPQEGAAAEAAAGGEENGPARDNHDCKGEGHESHDD